MAAENLALAGFDPPTVQLVANYYTDYALPAHILFYKLKKKCVLTLK